MTTSRLLSEIQDQRIGSGIKSIDEIKSDFILYLTATDTIDTIDIIIKELDAHITQLREQDFSGYITTADNEQKILVKEHQSDSTLNPIADNEAKVQALRYVKGMLLIAKYSSDEIKNTLLPIINNFYEDYQNKEMNADATAWLAEQFANCIAKNLLEIDKAILGKKDIYKKAREQLTMARDLGIMLEERPTICTISTNKDSQETIEISEPFKIREEYYHDELFKNIDTQPWIVNANKKAGLDKKIHDNWLNNFFSEKNGGKDFEKIKKLGSVAPPSARWLPIPANNQTVSVDVKKNYGTDHTEFVRMGVAIPFDIRNIDNMDKKQKEIAKKILLEVINNQINNKFDDYQQLYGELANGLPFYLNYQTLLSPLIGEVYLSHKDNNAKFIKFIKEIFNDDEFKQLQKEFEDKNKVELIIRHTNSAINRNAKYSNEMPEDNPIRYKKIDEFNEIKKRLGTNKKIDELRKKLTEKYGKELINELIIREKACDCLKDLLDNKSPYNALKTYQRNIMLAGLEQLAMGKQSLTLAGCKSARDRTGVFACTIKTMLDDPDTMRDWKKLEAGIVTSLKQGHAFRSMIFHSAIVKVSLVHKKFMKQLEKNTQKDIDELLIFSKRLDSYKENKINKEKMMEPDTLIKDIEDSMACPELTISNSKKYKVDEREVTPSTEPKLMMDTPLDELENPALVDEDVSDKKTSESFSKHNTIKSFIFFHRSTKEISLEKIEAELNQHQAVINTLNSKNYFNKKESNQLVECIKKCNKLNDDLKEILKHNPINKTRVTDLLSRLNNILHSATGQVATYENSNPSDSIKKLSSIYHKGDKELKIEQIIKKNSKGETVSKLEHADNLKELGKESGNYGSKIMLLNEAIKWIEEAVHKANLKAPISLTLKHHQSLDRKFLLNMVAYCKMQDYRLEFNGSSEKFSNKEIDGIINLYHENEQVLYKVEKKSDKKPMPSLLPRLITHRSVS